MLCSQAAWARFHQYGSSRVLCLLQRSVLTCLLPDGELHEVELQQPFTQIWTLPEGIILVVSSLQAATTCCWLHPHQPAPTPTHHSRTQHTCTHHTRTHASFLSTTTSQCLPIPSLVSPMPIHS